VFAGPGLAVRSVVVIAVMLVRAKWGVQGSQLSWCEFCGQAAVQTFLVMDSSQGRWAHRGSRQLLLAGCYPGDL
jgi:hypothetical protein